MNVKKYIGKSSSVEIISEDKSSSNKKSNNPKEDEYKTKKFKSNGKKDSHDLISKNNKTKKKSSIIIPTIPTSEKILYDFEEKKTNKTSRNVERKQSLFTSIKNKINNYKKRIINRSIKISDKESLNKSSSINMNKCLICNEKLSDNEKGKFE